MDEESKCYNCNEYYIDMFMSECNRCHNKSCCEGKISMCNHCDKNYCDECNYLAGCLHEGCIICKDCFNKYLTSKLF